MRAILLAALIATLSKDASRADDIAPLTPGKPAGIKNAQIIRDPAFYVVFGLGLIGAGIAIAESQNLTPVTTSTATTATSP